MNLPMPSRCKFSPGRPHDYSDIGYVRVCLWSNCLDELDTLKIPCLNHQEHWREHYKAVNGELVCPICFLDYGKVRCGEGVES